MLRSSMQTNNQIDAKVCLKMGKLSDGQRWRMENQECNYYSLFHLNFLLLSRLPLDYHPLWPYHFPVAITVFRLPPKSSKFNTQNIYQFYWIETNTLEIIPSRAWIFQVSSTRSNLRTYNYTVILSHSQTWTHTRGLSGWVSSFEIRLKKGIRFENTLGSNGWRKWREGQNLNM